MDKVRTGRCLCGAVRYTARNMSPDVVYCHCSQCRRQSGHVHAGTVVAEDALEVTGADNVTWYAASDYARRGFCSTCGSILFWKDEESSDISILAGSFDEPSGLRATSHIFVADKGSYYEIADGLPQYEASPEN